MLKFILIGICVILASLLPVTLGILACLKIVRGGTLKRWQSITIGCAVIFSFIAIFMAPSVPIFISVVIISGIILCSMLGLTWACRKFTGLSIMKSVALSTIPIVLLLLWLDLRFCVIVVNSNGQPIEVQASDVPLHRPNYHYFQNYITHEGHGLATGRIYFGLLTWLQCKDDWTFPGSFGDKNGRPLGDLKWKRAQWSEWPKVVVVPAE